MTWLLNLAYMASGGYPVEGAARAPRAAAVVRVGVSSVGRFVDVAAAQGVDSFSSAGGVIVDDFDNDGQLEILTSNFDSCGAMQLFTPRRRWPLCRTARSRPAWPISSAD